MAGEIGNPISFEKCHNTYQIIAGDTLIKRTRQIEYPYTFTRSGTDGNLITWKPYTGEKFIINSGWSITGQYVRIENLEIKYDKWVSRLSAYNGSTPSDIPVSISLSINATGIELYRCIIRDLPNGLGVWSGCHNVKITECLIFFNGWDAPDRGHGHGVYTQNVSGTTTFERCIIFCNYGTGMHAYSSNNDNLGFDFIDCVFFDNGVRNMFCDCLIGGADAGVKFSNINVLRNEIYGTSYGLAMGYLGQTENWIVQDNYVDNYYSLSYNPAIGSGNTITGNTFYGINDGNLIAGNTWGTRPISGKRIRIIDCFTNRAHIVIYNYDGDATVDVDMTGILVQGDEYSLTNVRDLTDIATGIVLEGNIVTIPMTGRTNDNPVLDTKFHDYFPGFGCFIIEKVV